MFPGNFYESKNSFGIVINEDGVYLKYKSVFLPSNNRLYNRNAETMVILGEKFSNFSLNPTLTSFSGKTPAFNLYWGGKYEILSLIDTKKSKDEFYHIYNLLTSIQIKSKDFDGE